jgi:TPP-dependent pyruvate/acetoin dehydrogenase alpha subunit
VVDSRVGESRLGSAVSTDSFDPLPFDRVGAADLGASEVARLLRLMQTIRFFEELTERAHMEGRLYGPFHSSLGQEAVAVGACASLEDRDVITSTHRGHGHVIAKGGDLRRMCAELWGRRTGYCKGKGGSMHLADAARGIIGENGVVGGSLFLGTGAALSFALQDPDRVALVFTGDGAAGQGVLHECLNIASLWRLPVVFLIENNGFAHSFRVSATDLSARAEIYGIPGLRVDGVDLLSVAAVSKWAVERARSGKGPCVIEAVCYRWRGHNLGDADHLYRDRDETARAREMDPLVRFKAEAEPIIGRGRILEIEQIARKAVNDAIDFAESSPPADPVEATRDIP